MILSLTTTHQPATDLGYLLHKNPGRINTVELAFGEAKIFYTEATEERCTAVLMLDLDPLALSRRRRSDFALEPYVNDRPYVVSSFMSVALGRCFGTAISGTSKQRPELVETPIPLRVEMPVVPSRGGEGGGESLVRRLFEPLGYDVKVTGLALDPEIGSVLGESESAYCSVELEATVRLCDLLRHVYVLIPVLDARKHYWVGEAEIDKLLLRGEGWLSDHPEKELISLRYLDRRRHLSRVALRRLDEEGAAGDDATNDACEEVLERQAVESPATQVTPGQATQRQASESQSAESPVRLHDMRLDRVTEVLKECGARSVVDLGCGSGKLLQRLVRQRQFQRLVGVDASLPALEVAHRRLHLEEASPRMKQRLQLLHGALTYRDERIEGFDAGALVEVIEHLDPPRLASLETVIFARARPQTVVVTTPNREYNRLFDSLAAGQLRHRDHRFEWTRAEFSAWGERVAGSHGYKVRFEGLGDADPEVGSPSQMAVFELADEDRATGGSS